MAARDDRNVVLSRAPGLDAPTATRARALALAFFAWGLGLLLLSAALRVEPALAVPAFAVQTGQPCAACHVGAFGPQLKPYGRDFKLHGYVASDGGDHGLPLAWTTQSSFTHTSAAQPAGAAPGFGANDNFALDQTSLFYAGRVTPQLGAFAELEFDAVPRQLHIGNVDIRHAGEIELFEQDVLWGLTANNNPTVQDPWNSTPAWGFPYNRSALAPTPMAATRIDGSFAQRVVGVGAYVLLNNLLYLEADAYKGLGVHALEATGVVPASGVDKTMNFIPYGRVALMRDWDQHHLEFGGYGLSANVDPGGVQTFGLGDRMTDLALDANYQFILNPNKVTSDMLSAHATFIHETGWLAASQAVNGAFYNHLLETTRIDASYSFAATVTPSVQYFRTTGNSDINYWNTLTGRPGSEGMIFEVAYVPWGKPDSPFPSVNARLAAQYVDYFCFDGSHRNASRNNALYISLWTGVKL
ncbi:MAG: hypothetical protein WB816_17160 [Methylocystis sp.]